MQARKARADQAMARPPSAVPDSCHGSSEGMCAVRAQPLLSGVLFLLKGREEGWEEGEGEAE